MVPDYATLAHFVRDLVGNDIPLCINTDNPYLIHTNLKQKYEIIGGDLGGDASELLDLSKIHAREHRFLNE